MTVRMPKGHKVTAFAPPYKAPLRRMTPEQVEQAKALLEKGLSYLEVGRKLGFSDGAIRNRFPGYNRPKGAW